MTLHIDHAELLGVSDSTLTLSFQVHDESIGPSPGGARILVDGEVRASVEGAGPTRLVRVEGEPIDVDTGHAAPLMRDWDGDGTLDLLVGQFGSGRLRIYPNEAKDGTPELGEHVWGKSEKAKMKVPTG